MKVILLLAGVCLFVNVNAQLWKQYSDSAKTFQEQKNMPKAVEYYSKANNELEKDSAISITNAQVLTNVGLLYFTGRQYAKAELAWIKVKQIHEKLFGKESLLYSRSCNDMATLYLEGGKYAQSEPLFLEAKQLRKKLPGVESAEYALTCNSLGTLYKNIGEYQKSEIEFLESKEIRKKIFGYESSMYAQSCGNLAILYKLTGSFEKAEPLYKESKNIFEKISGKNSLDYAQSASNLGVLFYDQGKYKEAEELYSEAKKIRQQINGTDNPAYVSSCNNLAILYSRMNEHEKAELLFIEAKQIIERVLGKNHQEFAANCNNLGIFYSGLGQYSKAETLLLEAKQIWAKTPGVESTVYAQCCYNLGNVYKVIQIEKAEAYYLEAKEIRQKILGADHPDYAQSCNGLARYYTENGQFEKAESLFFEARKILAAELGTDHPDYAINCDYLGNLFRETGQYKKAEELYIEALRIWRTVMGEKSQNYAGSKRNLANLYRKTKEHTKAQLIFEEVFQIENEYINQVFNFMSETEKLAYLTEYASITAQYFSFIKETNKQNQKGFEYNVSINNRNLILNDYDQLIKSIDQANDSTLTNKFQEWTEVRKQLSFWLSKPLKERGERDIALTKKANELEKELSKLSKNFKSQHEKKIQWENIQASLKSSEATIEFISFQLSDGNRWLDSICYAALLLKSDKHIPEFVYLFEKRQLDSLFNLKKPRQDQTIDLFYNSNALYNLVWQPLEKSLKNITKIYYAPSGLLHNINLSAVSNGNEKVIGDNYELIQMNNTAHLAGKSQYAISPSDKIVMYGGVNFNADSTEMRSAAKSYQLNTEKSFALRGVDFGPDPLPDLPFSEIEIDNIADNARKQKYDVSLLKGIIANEESAKAFIGNRSPAVLHFATHGKFFSDPIKIKPRESMAGGKFFAQSDNPLFRSTLLLAGANNIWSGKPVTGIEDGVLTAYEISNMYLPNTKLVVLSACETGLGDIQGSEGVYGLQRAFKMAGVQNLVMSLWSIPDNTTAEFMQVFYKYLFENKPIREAFSLSQSIMRNKYRSQPHKWAGLVLIQN